MKRRASLAVAGALFAVFAFGGTAFAGNVFSGQSNPYHYGGEYYGSMPSMNQAIPEPGKTNTTPNGAPCWYSYSVSPNQTLP